MIDIHAHILAGVDDGARTVEESLQMLKLATAAGVSAMVATPHVLDEPTQEEWKGVRDIFALLKKKADEAGFSIKLFLGAELFLAPDLPSVIRRNVELTLCGRYRHALMELPKTDIPAFCEQVFYELLLEGITPVLAHPERCAEIQRTPSRLEEWVRRGIMVQINAGSLLGVYGKTAGRLAASFLKKNLVHIIASDVHDGDQAYPLGMLRAEKPGGIGGASLESLATTVPEQIVQG